MTSDDWIKVTTRVPDHSNPVLTCCGWDGDEPTYYLAFFDNGKWRDNVDGQDLGNEPCAECGKPITNHKTAVQLRQAGEESYWCCSWACAKRFVGKATELTDLQQFILRFALGLDLGRSKPHKNYFFSKPDDKRFWLDCVALESMGFLCRKSPGPKPPEVEFIATVDGVQVAMGLVQRERIERWLATGEWTRRERAR